MAVVLQGSTEFMAGSTPSTATVWHDITVDKDEMDNEALRRLVLIRDVTVVSSLQTREYLVHRSVTPLHEVRMSRRM